MGPTQDFKVQGGRTPGYWQTGCLDFRAALLSQQTPIAAFLVLGCAFRIIRYAQNLPLWSDECFLSVNFINRGYRELLEPLDNGQIAPPLFLWAQRFIIALGGFSEWSLRLFPLICGLVGVFLFGHLARRVCGSDSSSLLLAVGIFAVSVHPIRHASEAKPYASDLMVSILLLVLAAEWLRRPQQVRWLWALVGAVPLSLSLSNPAVFVAGGIALGLAYPVWKHGSRRNVLAFGTFGITLIVCFTILYLVVTHDQSVKAIGGLRHYWAASFPPLTDLPRLAGWLISAHTGSSFAYPGGGSRGRSAATLLAFLTGAVALTRRGHGAIVACLLCPFALAFLAASLHRYPYGLEARLMQFVAPSICLLSGQGGAIVLSWVRPPTLRRKLLLAGMLGLVVCGIVPQVVSSLFPYRMLYDHQSREFARWFWVKQAENAKLVCFDLDGGMDRRGRWFGRKAWYLCNQMIYSPDRRRAGLGRDREISNNRPLRCVLFEESPENPLVREWQTRMERNLDLKEARVHHVPVTLGEGQPATEQWRILEFVPRPAGSPETIAVHQPADRLRR
jgi:Dolichyl-phosphate-mannose-protein mannosyltransferase